MARALSGAGTAAGLSVNQDGHQKNTGTLVIGLHPVSQRKNTVHAECFEVTKPETRRETGISPLV